MTDLFFDILLKSRVIVDNKEATVYFPRFIDDNSRLEQNIEKKGSVMPSKKSLA